MGLPSTNNELREWYCVLQLSTLDIASILKISPSAARLRLLRAGVALRSLAESTRLAGWKTSRANLGRRRTFTPEHKQNIATARQRYEAKRKAAP